MTERPGMTTGRRRSGLKAAESCRRGAPCLLGNGIGVENPIQGLRNRSERWRWWEFGGGFGQGEAAWHWEVENQLKTVQSASSEPSGQTEKTSSIYFKYLLLELLGSKGELLEIPSLYY